MLALTGEGARQTAVPFGHRRVVVGGGRHRCHLGDGDVAHFGELEDHAGGGVPSARLGPLLQGPNLLEGDALWGRRLRVGAGRLGLIPAGGAARAGAGTAGGAGVQDDTTWHSRERQRERLTFRGQRSKSAGC